MEITYDWRMNPLECYTSKDGNDKVVYRIHWQLQGVTGSYQAIAMGVEHLPLPSGSFIPFENLTKETIQGWILEQMGQDRYNQITGSIEQQILEKINPSVLILQPPWQQHSQP